MIVRERRYSDPFLGVPELPKRGFESIRGVTFTARSVGQKTTRYIGAETRSSITVY